MLHFLGKLVATSAGLVRVHTPRQERLVALSKLANQLKQSDRHKMCSYSNAVTVAFVALVIPVARSTSRASCRRSPHGVSRGPSQVVDSAGDRCRYMRCAAGCSKIGVCSEYKR